MNEKKTMFVVFFTTTGPLLFHEVPSGLSIDGIYYRDECLKPLLKNLSKKRPSSGTNGVKLYHDNARPHVKNIVFDYLREEKIKLMAHPPYSPDLAPSDFWLFGYLKDRLGSYPDAASLSKAITKELNAVPIEEYRKTFEKWIERMKLCIEHQANYFEHLRQRDRFDAFSVKKICPMIRTFWMTYVSIFVPEDALELCASEPITLRVARLSDHEVFPWADLWSHGPSSLLTQLSPF